MMKRKDGNTGFWAPGFSIFQDELAKEERERLGTLKAKLKTAADPVRKDDLRREIAALKAEFKTKGKNSRYSLFVKT